jgi:hypothetical protein
MPTRAAPSCPVCGLQGVPIVYGFPLIGDMQDAERGLILLGGCVMEDEDPRWACDGGHRWRDVRSHGGRNRRVQQGPRATP